MHNSKYGMRLCPSAAVSVPADAEAPFFFRFLRTGREPSVSGNEQSEKRGNGEGHSRMPASPPKPEPSERSLSKPSPVPQRPAPVAGERGVNVFCEGLVIEGNVVAETDIRIYGTVRGNVVCRSDIELSGEVTGDIEARNVRISRGSVQGDIRAREGLSIEDSVIKGNLTAAQAQINNRIEGDIVVRGTLSLLRAADVKGDITAAGLSVEEGAVMNGRITISREQETPGKKPEQNRTAAADMPPVAPAAEISRPDTEKP